MSTVRTGKAVVEVEYEIINLGTEEEPMYDFTGRHRLLDVIESDEWFPTADEAEDYVLNRLGAK